MNALRFFVIVLFAASCVAPAAANNISSIYYLHNIHPGADTGVVLHDPVRVDEGDVYCSVYTKYLLSESPEVFYGTSQITNMYAHFWVTSTAGATINWAVYPSNGTYGVITYDANDAVGTHDGYKLFALKMWQGDETVSEADMSTIQVRITAQAENLNFYVPIEPVMQSFVIFNLEDANTLQNLDRDGDGISDYDELYEHASNPFSRDTDMDGKTDYQELGDGTDLWNPDDNGGTTADYAMPSVVWVDNYTDQYANGSYEHPYDDFESALGHTAWNWDTITVLDGNYDISSPVDFGGENIKFRSAHGPNGCTIDCGNTTGAFLLDNSEGISSTIEGFTIQNGAGTNGGAIYLGENVQTRVKNCRFIGNNATVDGGAIYSIKGNIGIFNCEFIGNTAGGKGGAVYYAGGTSLLGTYGVTVRHSLFTYNEAAKGGAFAINAPSTGTSSIYTSTFVGNAADVQGGALYVSGMNTVARSCALWENSANNAGPQIALDPLVNRSYSLNANYCDVDGGSGDVSGTTGTGQLVWGNGNFDSDPLFADQSIYGDFRLSSGSPCADEGDPSYTPLTGEYDLAGNDPIINSVVDIGAFEIQDANKAMATPAENEPLVAAGEATKTSVVVSPNPCNPRTTVAFSLLVGGNVDISVVDIQGRAVTILQSGYLQAGEHSVQWNGNDRLGRPVGSGMYFVTVDVGGTITSRRVAVVK